MFRASRAKLLGIVDRVLYIEEPVFSKKFRIAGSFDLLCMSRSGKVVLLDYKNTRRAKKREDIVGYRIQLAFYSIMIKETLGIDVEEQKIFMVNREGFSQVFTFNNEDTTRKELVEIRKKFFDKFGY